VRRDDPSANITLIELRRTLTRRIAPALRTQSEANSMGQRIEESKRTGLTKSSASESPSIIPTLAADGARRRSQATRAERTVERVEERHRRIAEIAYYRAERRGFANGSALEDWLIAERAVDADDWNLDL
jgi:hypothetical protein